MDIMPDVGLNFVGLSCPFPIASDPLERQPQLEIDCCGLNAYALCCGR
jgi:hypothetical protein